MARSRRGRGEGGIYQRKSDGQWVGCVSLGYDGAGKRRRRIVYGDSKKAVREKMNRLQGDLGKGVFADAGSLKLGDFLPNWLSNTASERLQPGSIVRYDQAIRNHLVPIIGHVLLAKLRVDHVEHLYAELKRQGASNQARRMAGTVLNQALRHAVKRHLIAFNPANDVAKPSRSRKEMLFLTEPQMKVLLTESESHRLHALFVLALGSGMRQGELLGLQWSDINFEKGTVSVVRSLSYATCKHVLKEPKTKSSRRVIGLPQFVMKALERHRANMLKEGNISRSVFCVRNGSFLQTSHLVSRILRPIIASANANAAKLAEDSGAEAELLPSIRFHDLRHSHASLLISQGCSIKAISSRLGHSNIAITLESYGHLMPNDDEKLVATLQTAIG
jgi:integrase